MKAPAPTAAMALQAPEKCSVSSPAAAKFLMSAAMMKTSVFVRASDPNTGADPSDENHGKQEHDQP